MQTLTLQSGRHFLRLNPLFSSRSRLQQSFYHPHQNWNRVRHHFAAASPAKNSKLSARQALETGKNNAAGGGGGGGGGRCVSSSGGVPSSSSTSNNPPAQSSGFLSWYLRMLDDNPMSTKSVTAAIFFTASDITAQGIERWAAAKGEEPRVDWDKERTMRMLAVGLLMSAPSLHLWFNLMAQTFPNPDVWSAVKKVCLAQMIFGPCFNALFFSVNGYAQGERGQQILDRLKRDLIPTLQNGLMFWPLLDFINFRYFPVRFQVLFNNCCSFVWTIYLTSMAGKSGVKPIQA